MYRWTISLICHPEEGGLCPTKDLCSPLQHRHDREMHRSFASLRMTTSGHMVLILFRRLQSFGEFLPFFDEGRMIPFLLIEFL
jgi:hypothetical protein